MASICRPTFPSPSTEPIPHTLSIINSRFTSPNSKPNRRSSKSRVSISRVSESPHCCRCVSNNASGGGDNSDSASEGSWRWDFGIQETIRNASKRFDEYLNLLRDETGSGSLVVGPDKEEEDWDWERWRKHFVEVEKDERIVSILKSQLARAVKREDYEDASRIKVAIAAVTANDTVGKVKSYMKKFVEEECYRDAALLRDYAGAGLVGWWAGISEDDNDPYGRIIHISAEYGRYVARSFNPRQLATGSAGEPLFEVYLTDNKSGDYKQQAVYLKRSGAPQDQFVPSFKMSGSLRGLDSRDMRDSKSKLFERNSEEAEDSEDGDDGSFDNVLRDMIPGLRVKVVKMRAPEKADRDQISKVIEQRVDEDDKEKEKDYENADTEDEAKSENDEEQNGIALGSGTEVTEDSDQNKIAVEVVIGDSFIQKMLRGMHVKDLIRVPARLEKRDRLSFTFTVEEDANEHLSGGGQFTQNKRAKLHGQRSIDHVMLGLVKSIGRGKVPMKVLKDVGELINFTLNQAQNHQPLSGSTTFNRIDVSSSSDPLNGLYIGSHGLYASEVICMKRKFGQWNEDGNTRPSKFEFYEYVEAVKLTGDAYVPAGQVAFRAKIGKRYQLPHKGIIPREFGVVARYRGQGRLAELGFKNPRWVDGELVILDGKYIKGGPVVGFVYWAPEFHFLVFFNRLRLQE